MSTRPQEQGVGMKLSERLRDRAKCCEDACEDDGNEFAYRASFELDHSAADALDQAEAVLREARLQLEYLDGKFSRTGTTPPTIAKIDAALANLKSDTTHDPE